MMKVYVITSGRYSDYEIEVVFLHKPSAQRYVDEKNVAARVRWGTAFSGYDEYRIEEYDTIGPARDE